MARRKLEKRHIRNIQKTHRTYYVTLPVDLMRGLKWRERQKVEIHLFGRDKLIIKDWKKR